MKKSNYLLFRFLGLLSLFLIGFTTISFGQFFYSQGDGDFSDLTNWNSAIDGSGSNPVIGDLTSGALNWSIRPGHTITVDQNIDVAGIAIAGGTLVHAANTISSSGGTKTFIISSGTYQIATATLPMDFEVFLLPGGTIEYNGAGQTIGHLDADGDPITYNNLTVSGSGTKTFGGAIDINGSFTIDANVNVSLGTFTHTVGGSWIQNGSASYTLSTSTVDFDGSGFQQINNPVNGDNIEFNNLTISGGGVVSVGSGSTVQVRSDFSVTGSSSVQSASNFFVQGNFSVAGGSSYTQTAGYLEFDGSGNQTIDINNTTLTNLYFDNGAPNTKTVTGDITTTANLIVFNDAILNDAGGGQTHNIGGTLRIDGVVNWQGEVITNGQIQDNDDNAITLGTANLTANGGSIEQNDALTLNGDFTIASGTFNVEDGASVGGNGAGDTFTLAAGASMDVEGVDNFPTNFTTYTVDPTSRILYTRGGNQTIRGGFSMGELELGGSGVKTADAGFTVTTFLDLNNGIALNLGGFTHTIGDRIQNNSGASVTSTGDVTLLVSDGANYELIDQGTYTFNNLTINSSSLTASYVFDVSSNVTVNGNLNIQNAGGNPINRLILDMNAIQFINDFGDTWTIGANVEIRTSGATEFNSSVNFFNSVAADILSIIHYTGAGQTISNAFTYGSLWISGSGNKTAAGALDVNGDLYYQGGNHQFILGSFTHTVAAAWQYPDAYIIPGTSTIVFDGANQTIEARPYAGDITQFNNVTFAGTGTKTLDDDFDVDGNLVINPGVTVDATGNDVDFTIARDWTDNGTFTQSNGTTTFDGASGNQNLTSGASSTFGSIDINKGGGTRRVTATTDVRISLDLDVRNTNEFRFNNQDVYIGEDLDIEAGATWTSNASSTLFFNGTNLQQIIVDEATTVFTNLDFSGNGTKNITDPLDVNGNWNIQNGATVDGNNLEITVAGNWTNDGSFQHVNQVVFDGANQTINASAFNRIVIAGTNTKTLGGGITVTDDITINVGSTLDASASNYSITVGDDWTNNGTFTARNATVTFNGNNGDITTGGDSFYNLSINKNAGQQQQLLDNLTVLNNLTVPSGEFETDGFDITVGGSFVVDDLLNVNNVGPNITQFTFTSTGTDSIKTNGNLLRDIVVNGPGGSYILVDNLELFANHSFTLTDGSYSLNTNTMTLNGSGTVTINGGTFDIDENAILEIPDNSSLTNAGGTLQIVGAVGNPARITRSGGTGGYTITQTSGSVAARYYEIQNTEGAGFTISGGTVDATNNFSDGRFSDGSGSQYLFFDNIALTTTAVDVIFNSGPTYNVTRTAGSGTITFQDPSGPLAGEAFENDGGTFIDWTFPGGIFWDGGGDGTSWADDLNWSGNSEPTNGSNVILNHDNVAAAYSVVINSANEEANRVTLDAQGGNPIGLTITGGFDLAVSENFTMGTSTTLTINNASSELQMAENFANSGGTISNSAGTFLFNGTAGSHSIDFGGQSINNFTLNAPGATYQLGSGVDVSGDVTLTDGTLDVSTNNYTISVAGDWSNVGLTTFNARAGSVLFDLGGTATQTIEGGPFYNLTLQNGTGTGTSTKQLSGNIDVNNRVTIEANSVLDAQTFNIFVGEDWVNNSATTAFINSGTGTVTFDGAGTQELDNGTFATTFNNVNINTSGTVDLNANTTVNGNVQVSSSVGTFNLQTFTLTGAGGSNSLTVSGGSSLRLLNGNFPTTFETIDLASNSTVEYLGDVNETIFATTYGNIEIQSISGGTPVTKTLGGDIVVEGRFDIDDNETTLDVDGFTITLAGAFNYPAGGQPITWDNGTLNHNGGNFNFDVDLTSYANVILAGTGNKSLLVNINVTGDFTVQNGVQFLMDDHTLTATGAGTQDFNVDNGAIIDVRIPSATGVAFPTGFDNYGLGLTSTVELLDGLPQTIFDGVTYGNLILGGGSTATLNGDLDVDGDFDSGNVTILDGGFDMNFGGSSVNLNNYSATGGTTVTFDGTSQDIFEDATNLMTFSNVVFAGTGTKTFTQNGDNIDVNGTLTINSGITVVTGSNWFYSGASFNNSGTFNHTSNVFTFDGGAQSIDPGANNSFDAVTFTGGSTKTFSGNGADINDVITINAGTTVDLGSLTHNLGYNGANFNIIGTLNAANANIILDGPNPDLPAITVNDLTLATTGQVDLLGNLDVNGDLTINAGGPQLDVEAANYSINIGGDFINNGDFIDREGTVTFDGSSSPVTITTDGDFFYNVNFSPGAAVTYNLTSPTNRISRQMTIGSNATLDLNGQELTLGSGLGAGKIYTVNGTLEIDANADLIFDNQTSATSMGVNGTLRIVGTSGNIATLSSVNEANTRRTALTINNGGTIEARHYLIDELDNNGLVLNAGASVDATNNFSDGTWSGMVTAGGGPYYYLQTNNVTITNNIQNVTFSFAAVPTVGVHYNVQRSGGSAITFAGSISGTLAGATYEDDSGTLINWPVLSVATWTGAVNTDWHLPGNWSSAAVPNSTTDVVIPLVANNPTISSSDASAQNLEISNGALTLSGSRNLDVNGNLTIGTGANAGALVVTTSASQINVSGNWTRGGNGIFSNGGGTVVFDAPGGAVTITPQNSAFGNVEFNGSATFGITGTTIDINGNLTLTQGTMDPNSGNYILTLAGDYTVTGGSFDTGTNGFFQLDGAAQSITDGQFDNLTVLGSGTKTLNGTNTINDDVIIVSTLATAAGATLDVAGDFTIAGGGTFNDAGPGTTNVAGPTWNNSGTYTGTGTIIFDGGNQIINASNFHNITLSGTGTKQLGGNITVANDLLMESSFGRFETNTYTTTGTAGGTFTVQDGQTIWVEGSNNFPGSFGTYALGANTITDYRSTSAQTIRGGVSYGTVRLFNANTKTLGGNITIQNDLDINDATLDVSGSNYTITIGDDFFNNDTGSFIARVGDVIFNGNLDQQIRISPTGTKDFYKITVDKSGGEIQFLDENHTILDNLVVSQGNVDANGLQITISGGLDVTGGNILTSGTYILNSTSGTENVRTNGSTFENLTINGTGTTFTLLDDLTLNGDFTLSAGIFDGNGNTVTLGNGAGDIVSVNAEYRVGANGTLRLGNTVNLTVSPTGTFRLIGSAGNPATLTARVGGQTYAFQVNGTIHAQHYLIEYVDANGIVINSGGTIDATNNFSNGTFANGTAGGTFLRIENTQTLSIDFVNFSDNPGGNASNVTKVVAASGTLTFDDASGVFAGETFDDDPNNLIDWPTPIVLTWTGGTNTDWYTASNWTANVGPNIVPTGNEDVIIATATNQPIITADGAVTGALTVNAGATLVLNTPNEAAADLQINGNFALDGTLTLNSTNDTVFVAGAWERGTAGVFNNGSSAVVFNAGSGTHLIDNGSSNFYDLIIDASAGYILASELRVANDFRLLNGSLDVSGSNYDIRVGGDWQMAGSFTPRNGEVLFNRSSAGTATIDPGSGDFYDLVINGGASTTFQVINNNVVVENSMNVSNSTFDLNGRTLTFGDNAGTDVLSISGTMIVDANAQLLLGTGSQLQVNSGGNIQILGDDISNVATVTRHGSGRYSFVVSSGGEIDAQFYAFEYMNTTGIQVSSGATIDATNNFSNGTFSNGASGGRYLNLVGLTFNFTPVMDVTFNAGATVNVRATSGSGNYIEFQDASGLLAGPSFEDDDGAATTGAVRWVSTSTNYTWTGNVDTDWHTAGNWDDGGGPPALPPDASVNVIIPNVANDPIISGSNAECDDITIASGAVLTINTNRDLSISGSLNNGGTISIPNGSTSNLTVALNFANSGTLNFGNASTLTLTAPSGNRSIETGGSALNNLTLNGAATFQLTSNLDINGDLTISAGTLDVTGSNYQITVGGDWTNNASFTSRSGRVIFDGSAAQSIDAGGTASTKRFYNLRIAKSNTATLTNDLYINNNFELNSGSLNLGANAVTIIRDWNNTGVTVTPGTSTVTLSGANSPLLRTNSQAFNNLTVNKTGVNQVSLSSDLEVNGTLTVTAGTLFLNGRALDFGDGADNISIQGTVNVDAGAFLRMHQNASASVLSGGTIQVVGSNSSSLATISSRTGTAGWNMSVTGTISARFAQFLQSGGDGITLNAAATVNTTNDFENSTFDNGTGNAYLTLNTNQSLNVDGVEFSQSSSNPTYNVQTSSGSGTYSFTNYSGDYSGAIYENDPDPTPGRIVWQAETTVTGITGAGPVVRVGNDEFTFTVTSVSAGSNNVTVRYLDEEIQNIAGDDFITLDRHVRVELTGPGTVTGNVIYRYKDGEVSEKGLSEGDLRLWQRTADNTFTLLSTAANLNQATNTITVSGVTIGTGTLPKTGPGEHPELTSGNDEFFLSNTENDNELPVELASFDVELTDSEEAVPLLKWITATERENYGFYVERMMHASDTLTLKGTWSEIGFVGGHGDSYEEVEYEFEDSSVEEATDYAYRLRQVDYDGKSEIFGPLFINVLPPAEFELKQNYPNPFNPNTIIPYNVAVRGRVRIMVYDMLGRLVSVLADETMNPGRYQITFDASRLSSGVYLLQLQSGNQQSVKKITLLR